MDRNLNAKGQNAVKCKGGYIPSVDVSQSPPQSRAEHSREKDMGGSAHASYAVGTFLFAGGLAGYVRAQSKPSLYAGVGLGSLMVVSGMVIQSGDDFRGHTLALIASGLVVGGTLPRAIKTQKVVPTAIALLGLVSGVYQGRKVWEWL
ncbi:hypothetical protein NSK_002107 [Nannochloropsis salina CCMP1776]|uniref:Transmembrane protein 14C n=1 Tax=Nannochloropsis salina CCMP1776 TaxID=1027361 RepID=A0A4D9D4T0_9STRA|nr:hypothetical protein NSK_002107 [Nannochloropsis salina CCMP1776]|eukprot:TFJ86450.1 hypothetical protein NSK_002107 [Nannochloropsis salina CCMP1776]